MTNLSDAARKALIDTAPRQGGKVPLPEGPLLRELKDAGLVGRQSGCLTSKGTIARERAVRQAEDLAFGA